MLRQKPWFKKLLLSYLPLYMGISIILILIFVMAAFDEGKRESERANLLFARQVLQSVDYSLRTVDHMILNELGVNEIWQSFFNPRAGINKYLTEYELSNKLSGLVNNYPLIDSIYLVRFADQMIMTNYAMLGLDRMPDKQFIVSMQEETAGHRFWTSPRLAQTSGAQAHRLFSLVIRYPILSGDEGLVIINFRTAAIGGVLAGLSGSNLNFVMLCDGAENFMTGFTGKEVVRAGDEAGCKQRTTISTVHSDYTGWTVHSGINKGSYAAGYATPFRLWIYLAILVVLGGMGAIIYLTSRNYQPIRKIIDRIEGYRSATVLKPPGSGKDELSFIERALDDLIKQTGEDVIFKRKLFFQELFQGNRIIVAEEWMEQTRSMGWKSAAAPLQASLIDIDRYDDFCLKYNERDRGLIRFALANVGAEIAQKHGLDIWAEWLSNQRMGILASLGTGNVSEQELSYIRAMNGIVQWVKDNLNITITIALGTPVDQAADIGLSYESAAEALKYKSVFGNSRVITQLELPVQSAGDVYHQLQPIRAMVTAFRIGEENWRLMLEQIMSDLEQNLFSRDDIVNLMNYMLFQLNRELTELPDEICSYWRNTAAPALERVVNRMDTLDELSTEMTVIMDQQAALLKQAREQRASHSVIQEVRTFIEEHYNNPDMSLTYIGEHFHIKPNYISRLFKEDTGDNFVDYLARIRIERAMSLLKETDLPVQDIVGLVGYSHYVSFNRVFKKIAGVTPGDYRRGHWPTSS